MKKMWFVGLMALYGTGTTQAVVTPDEWAEVSGIYQRCLGRAPDVTEQSFWTATTTLTSEGYLVKAFLALAQPEAFDGVWTAIMGADFEGWEAAQARLLVTEEERALARQNFDAHFQARILTLLRDDATDVNIDAIGLDERAHQAALQAAQTPDDLEAACQAALAWIERERATIFRIRSISWS